MTKYMRSEINTDWKTRDQILAPYLDRTPKNDNYDLMGFEGLPLNVLKDLIDNKFAFEDERQNSSPSIGDFIEMMKEYPILKAHGYIISPRRDDYRLSLEGLHILNKDLNVAPSVHFMANTEIKIPSNEWLRENLGSADEFNIYEDDALEYMRSWWD